MQHSLDETTQTAFSTNASSNPSYILIVDDEPSFCTVLSEILRSFGYMVRHVHTVRHAYELLKEQIPDLILTDVMMPDIDGLTFIRQMRADPERSSIPIIVVSAKSQPEDIAASKDAGADACLIKPFSARELRQVVHDHLHSKYQ
jgi:CheY-like chemotaxis protein